MKLVEILSSPTYNDTPGVLTLALGKDIAGKPVVADLARMPHLLVAGTTGSGKSVAVNAMILSLLYKAEPKEVRLILIDPKMLELSVYEGIPHLLAPVVTDMKLAPNALNWCVGEMERRYKLMSQLGVRNLAGYNAKVVEAKKAGKPLANPFSLTPEAPEPLEEMPLIVVVVDELADLMMVTGKKIEELIARIAQKARAAGIHLILATQRPSVDVITGLIKANIPSRIAFQVASKVDSRTILDQMGAEALLGQGDMLYHAARHRLSAARARRVRVRRRGAPRGRVPEVAGRAAVHRGHARRRGGRCRAARRACRVDGGDAEADPMYDQAVAVVLKTRRPSISLVQRHLRIGYNRAARLIEQMERAGLVSPMQTNGNREVLVPAGERRSLSDGCVGGERCLRHGCCCGRARGSGRGLPRGPAILSAATGRSDGAADHEAQAIERARALLPADFCGPAHLRHRLRLRSGIRARCVARLRAPVRGARGPQGHGRARAHVRGSRPRRQLPRQHSRHRISAHPTDEAIHARSPDCSLPAAIRACCCRPSQAMPRRWIACALSCDGDADGARRRSRRRCRPERPRGRRALPARSSFARPGKFRWTVEKPYGQLLVGDGAARLGLRRGLEPGHRAQSRRGARRDARGAAVRQTGGRARLRVEGPAGGAMDWNGSARRPRVEGSGIFLASGWASMRRA